MKSKLWKGIKVFCFCLSLILVIKCKSAKSEHFDIRKELSRIYAEEEFTTSFLRADKGVEELKQELKNSPQSKTKVLKAHFAMLSLLNGDASNAILYIEELLSEKEINSNQESFSSTQLKELLALSYFRKGEIDNFLKNHNNESCIIPFKRGAIHIDSMGAKRALLLYTEIIEANPINYTAQWMLNLSYKALGKYPQEVPKDKLILFNQFDKPGKFPVFNNVANEAGVDMKGLYGGVIVDDFNGDGLSDIFATSALLSDNVALYLRNPYGGFFDATAHFGLNGITGGVNAIQADFNNDGYLDILILRGGWLLEGGKHPNSLLRNNGDGTFSDITFQAGLLEYSPTHTAVWGDFDNDGLLDLFVGNETGTYDQVDNPGQKFDAPQHPSRLYRNNGNETFSEISNNAGLKISKWVKGAVLIDYNNDGKQDLYLSCYNGKNHLFRNDSKGLGHFKFTDVTIKAGVAEPFFSFPVIASDVNNDGWEDLIVFGYFTSGNELAEEFVTLQGPKYPTITYINQKNGTFIPWNKTQGPLQSVLAMGVNIGDVDNDGFVDILAGTGSGSLEALYPNVMLKNSAGKQWDDVTSQSRLGHLQKTHGIAFEDFDDDGDLDIYMNIGGLYTGDFFWNALYENSGNEQNWLKIKLIGNQSNRSAIGAKVIVTVQKNNELYHYYRTLKSESSYGGSPLLVHFGLGDAQRISQVRVEWPSGKTSIYNKFQLNTSYQWSEDKISPLLINPRKTPIKSETAINKHLH